MNEITKDFKRSDTKYLYKDTILALQTTYPVTIVYTALKNRYHMLAVFLELIQEKRTDPCVSFNPGL